MTTLTSAVPPLYEAIAATINADAALRALLAGDRVYSLTAPSGAEPDYIVLGSPSASGLHLFGLVGEVSALTLHVWTAGTDHARGFAIYGELFRVLNMKPLAVQGHRLLHGSLSLVTSTLDPGGELAHLVAMYRPTTLPT